MSIAFISATLERQYEVDVVDSKKGQELGFSNIATSLLFVSTNLAPLATKSQQKFFQKSSK